MNKKCALLFTLRKEPKKSGEWSDGSKVQSDGVGARVNEGQTAKVRQSRNFKADYFYKAILALMCVLMN